MQHSTPHINPSPVNGAGQHQELGGSVKVKAKAVLLYGAPANYMIIMMTYVRVRASPTFPYHLVSNVISTTRNATKSSYVNNIIKCSPLNNFFPYFTFIQIS